MRITGLVTIASGTPVNVATALGLDAKEPQWASRWVAQALHGGSGLITVFDGFKPRGTVPVLNTSTGIEITAATAPAPGGSYSDTFDMDADNQGDIDLSLAWIDGAHTGDTVAVSANKRV